MPFVISLLVLGAVVVLAAASAVVSGMETALFSLPQFFLMRLKERAPQVARTIDRLIQHPRRVLHQLVLADTLINLPLAILCIFLLREHAAAVVAPAWAKALVLFGVLLVLCDLIPKLVALALSPRFALPSLALLDRVDPWISPLSSGLDALEERLVAPALRARNLSPRHLSEEELGTLIEMTTEHGVLLEYESVMINDVIKLGSKTARDVATPRVDMIALDVELTNEQALQRLRARPFHRVPVFRDTPDNIIGILDVQDFLLRESPSPHAHFGQFLSRPLFVPETLPALDLLLTLRAETAQLVVVLDDFGGVEGVVSLADLSEEVVSDAVPLAEHGLYIEAMGEGRVLANGNARLEDLAEVLGVPLAGEGIDTINGLLSSRLGTIPKAGSVVRLGPLHCEIRRANRQRVREVLLELVPEGTPVRADRPVLDAGPLILPGQGDSLQ